MFWNVARFEVRYQLRNPVCWAAAVALFVLGLSVMIVEDMRFGSGPTVRDNAPTSIAAAHLLFSILFMFVPAAFVANVVIRDDETGFGSILRSTRITKFDYLVGRFTGAFVAAALAFMALPLAIWLGTFTPGVDADMFGPNRFADYARAYLLLAVPNILLASAVFFALATMTRSQLGTFLGAIGLLVLYTTARAFIAKLPAAHSAIAIADPFGTAAF